MSTRGIQTQLDTAYLYAANDPEERLWCRSATQLLQLLEADCSYPTQPEVSLLSNEMREGSADIKLGNTMANYSSFRRTFQPQAQSGYHSDWMAYN